MAAAWGRRLRVPVLCKCMCMYTGAHVDACAHHLPLFSFQPISNADFIVPVEIEGITHQVNDCAFALFGGGGVCV